MSSSTHNTPLFYHVTLCTVVCRSCQLSSACLHLLSVSRWKCTLAPTVIMTIRVWLKDRRAEKARACCTNILTTASRTDKRHLSESLRRIDTNQFLRCVANMFNMLHMGRLLRPGRSPGTSWRVQAGDEVHCETTPPTELVPILAVVYGRPLLEARLEHVFGGRLLVSHGGVAGGSAPIFILLSWMRECTTPTRTCYPPPSTSLSMR